MCRLSGRFGAHQEQSLVSVVEEMERTMTPARVQARVGHRLYGSTEGTARRTYSMAGVTSGQEALRVWPFFSFGGSWCCQLITPHRAFTGLRCDTKFGERAYDNYVEAVE